MADTAAHHATPLRWPEEGLTRVPYPLFDDPALQTRLPHDLAAARKLMQEAGFADGFEVTLDCPNNRYINDEEICKALTSYFARVGITARLNAQPATTFFQKIAAPLCPFPFEHKQSFIDYLAPHLPCVLSCWLGNTTHQPIKHVRTVAS